MKSRSTLALLALLVALAAAAVLVQGPWGTDRVREHAAALPGFAAGEAREIRIARAGAETLLVREGAGWAVEAPGSGETGKAPADAAAIETLLADLAAADVGAVVSKNAAKQAAYETDAGTGIAVRVAGPDGRVLAAFVVGKRGPDYASAYLKRDGATEVLLVSRDLRTPLARPNWAQLPKP